MADVAARAGVSRALVSLVFRNQPGASEQTEERVRRAAADLGYRPDSAARLLARGRSRTIGVLLTLHHPFHADLVEAIYPVAERLEYDVLLSARAPGRDERAAAEALLSHRCEALIVLGPESDDAFLAELADRCAALVVVGAPSKDADSVRTAEGKGVRQTIDHLITLGHRRIAHVDGGRSAGSADRRKAYRATMRRYGLADHIRVVPGAHTEEAGAAAARVLAKDADRPTAVLAANDRCAVGLLQGFAAAGLSVPGDISVAGFDDSHLSHLSHIDLTTVRQDTAAQAEQAVRFAVDRLADAALPARDLVLDPRLVVRGTTGPPPA
ncbi:LacI family DNA-binding transcriptional regulator [Streptomyces smaragdinus]|nr:LacI family DNA-binding transcriptional regulator [Streptomyces smaragdinus]